MRQRILSGINSSNLVPIDDESKCNDVGLEMRRGSAVAEKRYPLPQRMGRRNVGNRGRLCFNDNAALVFRWK
jgi:hypothetical protein